MSGRGPEGRFDAEWAFTYHGATSVETNTTRRGSPLALEARTATGIVLGGLDCAATPGLSLPCKPDCITPSR